MPPAITVDDVLTQSECLHWQQYIDSLNPELATIHAPAGHVINDRVRNNQRVTFDDAQFAQEIFSRLGDAIPSVVANRQKSGNNERFRGYRYLPGQRFAPHYDGSFVRSPSEESWLTLLIYLNDDFTGGATNFLHYERSIVPRRGQVLLFQHHLLHEGAAVTSGAKYYYEPT